MFQVLTLVSTLFLFMQGKPRIPVAEPHLQFFGYLGVDCKAEDPFDRLNKNAYVDEVRSFSNVAELCVFESTDRLADRMRAMSNAGLRAVIDLGPLFFEPVATSDERLKLSDHYVEQWQKFSTNNREVLTHDLVLAFIPVHEPTKAGISPSDLAKVVALLKADYPDNPLLIPEAAEFLDAFIAPAQVDWLGTTVFGSMDPAQDPQVKQALTLLKQKRSRPSQKLVIFMEGQWLREYTTRGERPPRMKEVATGYLEVANREPDAIGILTYTWSGGYKGLTQRGTRELPEDVRA